VFDLSGDGGHGERPEVLAAVRRPSVGCLDQTDERELFEVSAFHAVVEIARGDRPRHRQVLDDDLVTAPLLFGRVGAGGQVIEFFPQLATAVPGWGARSGRWGMIAVFVGNWWRGGQGTCRHGTLRGDRHPSWHLSWTRSPSQHGADHVSTGGRIGSCTNIRDGYRDDIDADRRPMTPAGVIG